MSGITEEQFAKAKAAAEEAKLQEIIDEMKSLPQYRQYVQQRKLELLFGTRGLILDNLLRLGILH
jgi:hypothetical protein